MAKELCKRVKDDALKKEKKKEEYKELVKNPTHLCSSCGRVSSDPDTLCKPEKL